MRLFCATAAVLCALAAPAMAQSREPAREQADAAAQALNNPVVQDSIAGLVSNLAGIVLDTRVGPLAHYTDPRDGVRANDTLRDVERRRDPDFEKKLHQDTRRAVGMAGTAASDMAAMSGSLAETAAKLRAALEPLRVLVEAQGDVLSSDGGY